MNTDDFKERFIKLEMAVEAQGIILEKLNLIIVGNGKKGLAEIARDLNAVSESLDNRLTKIECAKEHVIKDKIKKQEEKEKERKKDIKNIIYGIVGTLLLTIILEILRNPDILKIIFGGN